MYSRDTPSNREINLGLDCKDVRANLCQTLESEYTRLKDESLNLETQSFSHHNAIIRIVDEVQLSTSQKIKEAAARFIFAMARLALEIRAAGSPARALQKTREMISVLNGLRQAAEKIGEHVAIVRSAPEIIQAHWNEIDRLETKNYHLKVRIEQIRENFRKYRCSSQP